MEAPETGYRRFAGDGSVQKSGFIFLDPGTSYKAHGRRLGVVTSLAIGIVPFLPVVGEYADHPVDFAMHLSVSVIIGILELPFLCTVLQFCRQIQTYLVFFEVRNPEYQHFSSHLSDFSSWSSSKYRSTLVEEYYIGLCAQS